MIGTLRVLCVTLLIGFATSLGCASDGDPLATPDTSGDERDDATASMGNALLDELLESRTRLLNIEYRLSRHLSRQCGGFSRPHPGALFTTRDSFVGDTRDIAADRLNATERPTVVHVVPGGSFDRAGIEAGDALLALDGEAIDSTAEVSAFMLASGTRQSVQMTYQRGAAKPVVRKVMLDSTCPIRVGFSAGALIVPWQDERLVVVVPLGLLRVSNDDDLLALVVAHQYAHSLYDRREDDALTAERRADRLGLEIAHGAGFDISGAVAYWEDVAMEYPLAIRGTPARWSTFAWEYDRPRFVVPHPEIAKRIPAIRETVASLRGQRP